MTNQNYTISEPFACGLSNFIDSLHDRMEILNGRMMLGEALSLYDQNVTQNELKMIIKVRDRLIEIDSKDRMMSFLNSVDEPIIDSKLKAFLINEIKINVCGF